VPADEDASPDRSEAGKIQETHHERQRDMIKSILSFIADERGAESVEFGVTSVVVAAGAVSGLNNIKNAVKDKQDDMVTKLDEAAF
jgi:Flp pilus assembly pilin Flp